jgi:hypothetical protein
MLENRWKCWENFRGIQCGKCRGIGGDFHRKKYGWFFHKACGKEKAYFVENSGEKVEICRRGS